MQVRKIVFLEGIINIFTMFFKVILEEIMQFFKKIISNTHKEGYIYILFAIIITLFSFVVSEVLGFILLIISMWCIYFFRDPERIINTSENVISSPGDGIIVDISTRIPPKETGIEEEMHKVSIFLSVFNVHVNRVPLASKVERVVYHKGAFLNASVDKASEENERNTVVLESSHGKVALVQIAGLIARRIVCTASVGQSFQAGERYGIIKFGSRVDIYFPKSFKIKVLKGQTMVGGETVIAEI